MKKLFLPILCSLFVSVGCADKDTSVRYEIEVAESKDSERIAYSVSGTGKTSLIFIHGWSCDSRYFQNQIPVFAKDYQVIALDLAGHGNSSQERADFTVLSFAYDVKAVIEKEGIQDAILIGHSMGGGIIAEVARLMPTEVIGIIGIDTLHDVSTVIPQEHIDTMLIPFETDFQNNMRAFALQFREGVDPNLFYWIQEDMSSAPQAIAISTMRNFLGQYTNGEASAVFKDVNVPLVSINSTLQLTNEEGNKNYIKDYTVVYTEKTGHFPMLEKPKEFNALLLDAIKLIESKKTLN